MSGQGGIPVVKIGKVLLAAIEGDVSDQQAEDLQHTILAKIRTYRVSGVLIDLSDAEMVDSFLARSFTETARMASVLSATVIICGLQPAVAMTLVELGLELENVFTALDVDMGLELLQGLKDEENRNG